MRTLTLGDTGLTTSVLGYGCAGLMHPTEERDRFALLEAAWESGIRHFDVARYYGHGGAEGVLGKFLRETRRRDSVTITTKFGMEPSPLGQSSRGRSLMNFARRVATIHPGIRKLLSGVARGGVRTNRFDPESARKSLETSLRELSTDRVDFFLLHEATLEDTQSEGLLEFLEAAKKEGKIRAFGLGADFARTPEIVVRAPAFAKVVQIANGFGHWGLEKLPPGGERITLTHGSLKILPVLEAALTQHPLPGAIDESWHRLDSPRGAALAGWLLGLAMHDNPAGVVLFSSVHPDRIRANVANSLSHAAASPADWLEFRQMAAGALEITANVR